MSSSVTLSAPTGGSQSGFGLWLRRLGRALQHAPERLLHRSRRQAVLEQLRELGVPHSILFVCIGNLCRSPYAAARMERALPAELRERIQITSAGFIGAGRSSPAAAIQVAAGRGTDLSVHRSTPLSPESVRSAALVVVMDPVQQRWIRQSFGRDDQTVVLLGDLDPEPVDTRTIHDPMEQPVEVFEDVYARIDRCVEALAALLAGAAREA